MRRDFSKLVLLIVILCSLIFFFILAVLIFNIIGSKLLDPFPDYPNAVKLGLNPKLSEITKTNFFIGSCNELTFEGKVWQAFGTDESKDKITSYYEDLASKYGLRESLGSKSLDENDFNSRCYYGSFNRKQPTIIVTIIDVKTHIDVISKFFEIVPHNISLLILVQQGFSYYV